MSHIAIGLDTRPGLAFFSGLPGRLDRAADLLTIEDGFGDAQDGLDATLLANWLGPRTSRIGLLAAAPLNFLEPFHVSTAVATLDYVSQGCAGLLAHPLRGDRAEQARRALGALNGVPETDPAALVQDPADSVEVNRLLWDSWEDSAVIRDPVSQRFVDGAKLHYIHYKGSRFSVLGPSITPARRRASRSSPPACDPATTRPLPSARTWSSFRRPTRTRPRRSSRHCMRAAAIPAASAA